MTSRPAYEPTLALAHYDHTPISRLYTEILQEIFEIAHLLTFPQGKTTLTLSWVCHRWRDLVHQTSSLWCCIEFTNIEWVQTSLSRARGRDLEFHLYNLGSGMDPASVERLETQSPFVQLCLGNLSRIEKLEMRAVEDYVAPGLFPSSAPEWLTPAPRLRALTLGRMWLPPNVFSGVYPSLRSLVLSRCSFDWDTLPVIPGLKMLIITEPHPSADIDRIVEIFRILSPTVELIDFMGLFEHNFTFDPIDKIHLKNLEFLRLDEFDPDTVMHLLTPISLPSRTSIEIRFDEDDDDSESGEEMIQALIACRNLQKWPISSLEIRGQRDYPAILIEEDWSKMDGVDEARNRFNPTEAQTTRIELAFGSYDPDQVLTMVSRLPIHPIHQVVFRSPYMADTPAEYFDYVSGLGTVHCLKIELPNLNSFCVYINNKASQVWEEIDNAFSDTAKIANAHTTLGFQNLRELHISGTQYFDRRNFGSLRNWLLCRMMVNLPLDRLFLSNMEIPSVHWVYHSFSNLVGQLRMGNVREKDVMIPPVYSGPRNLMITG